MHLRPERTICVVRQDDGGMDATARQPEASTKILVNMMAGCALIEALALYALVFGFSLLGKL